jgi:catechol 2,3-dioxygenase-like lactoylglutathione lyase family enzyme
LFDHISLGVSSLERSAAFYDAVLAALGHVRLFKISALFVTGRPDSKERLRLRLSSGEKMPRPLPAVSTSLLRLNPAPL